jgi:hypothetical protein
VLARGYRLSGSSTGIFISRLSKGAVYFALIPGNLTAFMYSEFLIDRTFLPFTDLLWAVYFLKSLTLNDLIPLET